MRISVDRHLHGFAFAVAYEQRHRPTLHLRGRACSASHRGSSGARPLHPPQDDCQRYHEHHRQLRELAVFVWSTLHIHTAPPKHQPRARDWDGKELASQYTTRADSDDKTSTPRVLVRNNCSASDCTGRGLLRRHLCPARSPYLRRAFATRPASSIE